MPTPNVRSGLRGPDRLTSESTSAAEIERRRAISACERSLNAASEGDIVLVDPIHSGLRWTLAKQRKVFDQLAQTIEYVGGIDLKFDQHVCHLKRANYSDEDWKTLTALLDKKMHGVGVKYAQAWLESQATTAALDVAGILGQVPEAVRSRALDQLVDHLTKSQATSLNLPPRKTERVPAAEGK